MTDLEQNQDAHEFRAEAGNVWRITFGPLVWAVHFVLCYGATAMVCARGGAVETLRLGLGIATLLALAAIAWLGWRAWRQWDKLRDPGRRNDTGTGGDRHRFLGHAAFLLAIISFVGVAYVTLPILLIESCA